MSTERNEHDRDELELIDLPQELRAGLVEKYREHFRDEEPVVQQGLYCALSGLVYPIVSDIPIMLIEEALPASAVGRPGEPVPSA